MPANTVKVDRSTKWGNPFGDQQTHVALPSADPQFTFPITLVKLRTAPSLERCLDMFAAWCAARIEYEGPEVFEPLRGRNLACWCKPGTSCHADVLLEIANR
jgi:hypothetical protein